MHRELIERNDLTSYSETAYHHLNDQYQFIVSLGTLYHVFVQFGVCPAVPLVLKHGVIYVLVYQTIESSALLANLVTD